MSILPRVNITIGNGALGGAVEINDGIMGMVLFGPLVGSGASEALPIEEPVLLNSLDDAVQKGITSSYASDAYDQIKDFYLAAGTNTQLWVVLVNHTTTMSTATDYDITAAAVKMLEKAAGDIKMWGISRFPPETYAPAASNQLDPDVTAAVTKAQVICDKFAENHMPCRAIVGARGFTGALEDLEDFSIRTDNRVGVVLGSTSKKGYPAVGFTLGYFANRPVQRKISRVKDGSLPLTEAYFSNPDTTDGAINKKVQEFENAFEYIHDRGYIFFRTIPEKSGYFFNSDPSCSPSTDDYSFLSRGRVIDKAHRIAYATFINEIEDDVEIDENGYLSPVVAKGYQQKMTSAIEVAMAGEISGVEVLVNPAQQIAITKKVEVSVSILPKGYSSRIDVTLGFNTGN